MLDSIENAVRAVGKGEMVVVVDDEDRENEGDLVMAASAIDADDVNFMACKGKGLICAPIAVRYAQKFGLHPMVENNTDRLATNFSVSVDFCHGLTTGISMKERARTILALSDFRSEKEDFLRPGHVFPIIAKEGGVLERPGHTEAAIELTRMAGLPPVGVICEIIKDNGEMARLDDLRIFANKYGLKLISISDIAKSLSS